MNYPKDCWYVAATSDEVGDGLTARRLLDTPVLLFRLSDGSVAALEDRCAHRPYPLSAGHREGDLVVCGYHGCTYDATGRCVQGALPGQPASGCAGARPSRSSSAHRSSGSGPARPVVNGCVRLRRRPGSRVMAGASVGERRDVAANFLLLHEHYLDLTNVFAMHPELVPPGIEALPPLEEVEVSELSVSYVARAAQGAPGAVGGPGLRARQRRVVRSQGDGHVRDPRPAQADLHHHRL